MSTIDHFRQMWMIVHIVRLLTIGDICARLAFSDSFAARTSRAEG